MNSTNNNANKNTEEIGNPTENLVVTTSILTFAFTAVYSVLRIFCLKPISSSHHFVNSVILDISTFAPLATVLAAMIGVLMLFRTVRVLKKKFRSQDDQIKKLAEEIELLKREKSDASNLKSKKQQSCDYSDHPIKPHDNDIKKIEPEDKFNAGDDN